MNPFAPSYLRDGFTLVQDKFFLDWTACSAQLAYLPVHYLNRFFAPGR
jgi:hypothetical protein